MRGELSGSPPSILGLDFILSDWQIRQCLQNISNICIRILMMEYSRYLDVCVKNLLFMYKVSTYFGRQLIWSVCDHCYIMLHRSLEFKRSGDTQCLDPHDDQIDSSESWSLEPGAVPRCCVPPGTGDNDGYSPPPQIRLVSDAWRMILLCYELLFAESASIAVTH